MRIEQVERFAEVGRPIDRVANRGPRKPAQHQIVDLRTHHREDAVRVEDDERLGVHAKRPRHPDLEDLFERAEATGQREEGVGASFHLAFALAHVAGDDELVGVAVGNLHVDESLRDHADGVPAAGPNRARDRAHARDAAAA